MKMTDTAPSPMVLHTRCVTGVGGGPEKTILNSPRFLAELGYDSACAFMNPPEDPGFAELEQRAESSQARIISIPDRGALDWRVVRQLVNLCKREKVAIWHGHDYKSNFIGLLAKRFWPMRLISTVHGWVHHTSRTPLYYGIDRLSLRFYDEVICVSEDLQATCKSLGVHPTRCHLVPNAIDTESIRRRLSVQEAKNLLKVPAGYRLVGGVGRLAEEKGFDLLIEAVGQLARQGSRVLLWIAGEGPDRDRLEELVEALALGDRVKLLGNLNDPLRFFEALDVLVLSSRREGLPNVVLEAMSLEVPIVAAAVGGVADLVETGKTGVLCSSESAEDLAEAMVWIFTHGAESSLLARTARDLVEREYSFRKRMQCVAAIYDRALEPRIAGSA